MRCWWDFITLFKKIRKLTWDFPESECCPPPTWTSQWGSHPHPWPHLSATMVQRCRSWQYQSDQLGCLRSVRQHHTQPQLSPVLSYSSLRWDPPVKKSLWTWTLTVSLPQRSFFLTCKLFMNPVLCKTALLIPECNDSAAPAVSSHKTWSL